MAESKRQGILVFYKNWMIFNVFQNEKVFDWNACECLCGSMGSRTYTHTINCGAGLKNKTMMNKHKNFSSLLLFVYALCLSRERRPLFSSMFVRLFRFGQHRKKTTGASCRETTSSTDHRYIFSTITTKFQIYKYLYLYSYLSKLIQAIAGLNIKNRECILILIPNNRTINLNISFVAFNYLPRL